MASLVKDINGVTLRPGQVIIYAATNGRSAALRKASIIGIEKVDSGNFSSVPYERVKAEVLEQKQKWFGPKPGAVVRLNYEERICVVSS